MWTILEHRHVVKELVGAPPQIREKYEVWKNIVMHSGPEGLRAIKGFNDEALKADLKGHRSSRLNQGWRVLYKVVSDQVTVVVERVSKHDYRA